MTATPAGSPGRKSLPIRITFPMYERIADRRSALIQRTGRTSVTLCEALESLLDGPGETDEPADQQQQDEHAR